MSDSRRSERAPRASAFVLLAAAATLALGLPVVRTYQGSLRSSLDMRSTSLFLAVVALGFGFLFLSVWKIPRALAAGLGLLSLILVVRSGNVGALLTAAAILGVTLLTGDALARVLRGFEAPAGELSILVAAGCLGIGTALLLLGEASLVTTPLLASAAAILVLIRRRRCPELGRLLAVRLGASGRDPFRDRTLCGSPRSLPSCTRISGRAAADLSWDALAYHLRRFAILPRERRGPSPPISTPSPFSGGPTTTYLGLPFIAGGERAVRFAHLGIGFAAFGATAALARRLGSRARCPLALLALCAVPAACLQLRNTFVDLAAALFVAASAAEVVSSRSDPRRLRLAGFLFGGAIATKVFAALAAPALGALIARRHRISGSGSCPSRSSPRSSSFPGSPGASRAWASSSRPTTIRSKQNGPIRSRRSHGPPVDPEQPASLPKPDLAGFLRLPYDLTFDRETFSQYGSTGLLALPLLLGLLGWGRRALGSFSRRLFPSSLCSLPQRASRWILFTGRYFVPVASLYAVAAGTGLERLTDRFRGRTGEAAAVALGRSPSRLPFRSFPLPQDLRAAITHASPEAVLGSLSSYPLWIHVHADDRVLLLGDEDRYHCTRASSSATQASSPSNGSIRAGGEANGSRSGSMSFFIGPTGETRLIFSAVSANPSTWWRRTVPRRSTAWIPVGRERRRSRAPLKNSASITVLSAPSRPRTG